MKYLLMGLLGAVCGVAVALALLAVNPFLGESPSQAPTPAWTLSYSIPHPNPVVYTDGGLLQLPHRAAAGAELWEATIRRTAIGLYSLASESSEAGVAASRISLPHRASDLALDGPLLTDYWLVTVPGEGVVFLHETSNVWPFLRDVWLPIRIFERPWRGPARVLTPTVRQAATSNLIGANGKFAGRRGASSTRYEIVSFAAGSEQLRAELQLVWGEPAIHEPRADPGAE